MKKGWLGVFIVIFLLISVFLVSGEIDPQDHTANVRWSGNSSVYEFSNNQLALVVENNFVSLDDIVDEYVYYGGIGTLAAGDILTGNLVSVDAVLAQFNNVIAKFGSQGFVFNTTALSVSGDKNYTWTINLTDENGNKSTHTLTLTILNDTLAPRVSAVTPENFSIRKNETFQISLNYVEAESGFLSANLTYDDNNRASFDSDVRGSVTADTVVMSCDSSTCTYNLNPNSAMGLGDSKFFFDGYFELVDKAGNINNNYLYHIFIDNDEPAITLNAPADGFSTRASNYNFDYDLSDNSFDTRGIGNFDPEVNCSLYFSNVGGPFLMDSKVETNYVNNSILNVDFSGIADGVYDWYFICVDDAGWSAQSATRNITIDRFGPVINLTSHADGAVVNASADLIFNIMDVPSGLDDNWWTSGANNGVMVWVSGDTFKLDSADLLANANSLEVYANDTLGNVGNTNFTIYIDVTGPTIALVSPADGAFNNNVFTVNATDDYSSNLDCSLYINGGWHSSASTAVGVELTFNPTLAEGIYDWNVTCTDEVGNSAWSATRTVTIDTTDPVVSLSAPATDTNAGTPVNFEFIVDEDNLDKCELFIDGVLRTSQNNTNNFTGEALTSTNSAYVWQVNCTDLAGNAGASGVWNVYNDDVDPVLSNVNESSVNHNSATVIWDVTESTKNRVYYTTNVSASWSNTTQTALQASASVAVTGLSASTMYYYYVEACDQFDNCADDNNSGSFYNFTTTSTPSSPPSGGGGGSRRTEPTEIVVEEIECKEDWSCGSWTECADGTQTRNCWDWEVCGTTEFKPMESRECEMPVLAASSGDSSETESGSTESSESELGTNEEDSEGAGGQITGAATGLGAGLKNNAVAILGVLAVAGLAGVVAWKREAVVGGAKKSYHHVRNYKSRRAAKEEEAIRNKLRQSGLIK